MTCGLLRKSLDLLQLQLSDTSEEEKRPGNGAMNQPDYHKMWKPA